MPGRHLEPAPTVRAFGHCGYRQPSCAMRALLPYRARRWSVFGICHVIRMEKWPTMLDAWGSDLTDEARMVSVS